VKALIIGPPDTPYEYGFFEFGLKFGNDYPSQPPKVDARTTNKGQCRFNPNIYAQGKVCLSILGTWAGETSGEEWSSAQGLESILISIQSLMSSNPYENEPGFEAQSRASPADKDFMAAYIAKIRHETIRISVIQKLEKIMNITSDGTAKDSPPAEEWYSSSSDSDVENSTRRKRRKMEESIAAANFEPFSDLLKQRFLWYYSTYISTCTTNLGLNRENSKFTTMPFENGGNSMDGHFQYTTLLTRLHRMKTLIDSETESWASEGLISFHKESSIASKLARQFEQLTEHHKKTNIHHVCMSLDEKNNPFVWTLTYFGKPGSLLDGGCFKITIHLSPRFPDEQPRVRVETPIFHHRVSEAGVLCYFPRRSKSEDMGEHVRAVMDSLEEENPTCDPRTVVRGEASKLMWGSEQERKSYKRKVRGSAERSTED
jgi:ubiquitin-conjugating enzyme E2 Z